MSYETFVCRMSDGTARTWIARAGGHLTGANGALIFLSGVVAAQSGGGQSGADMFFQVACDAGLGVLITFLVMSAVAYIEIKGLVYSIIGLDKRRSSGSGAARAEGRQKLKDGMLMMAGGIVIVPFALGLLRAMGFDLNCLTPTLGF